MLNFSFRSTASAQSRTPAKSEIDGTARADVLQGTAANDDIEGHGGNDRLFGGAGNDTLDGGRGNDVLTGGAGADLFEFDRGDGRDTITDFRNGEDRIEIDDLNGAAIQSLINGARQVGNDVVITISSGSSITLQNFQLADLDLSDFAGVTPPPPAPAPAPSIPAPAPVRGRDIDGTTRADRLQGGAGNDTLDGGRGNDVLTGGAGADLFEFDRGDGRDTITDFRNGEDRIEIDDLNGAAIQSLINGARQVGNDVVITISSGSSITLQNFQLADLDLSDFAGVRPPPSPPAPTPSPSIPAPAPVQGRDINGTSRADRLEGGAGNDDIEGRGGNDLLIGGAGNDEIDGDQGNDLLFGGDGRDDLEGGSGDDQLDGGAGADWLEGGRGNDILTGGAGADVFEFERGDGRDRITDFVDGEDRLKIDDYSALQIQSLIAGAQQVGSDVVLSVSPGTTITIANMQVAQVDMSDFIF
jgi:Ca2+-binding RTX toxin-like protein